MSVKFILLYIFLILTKFGYFKNRVEDVKSKLKQMPVPELYCSGDGHMTFNRFEMIVKNDLNQLKKLVYKGFDDMEVEEKRKNSQ
uniref:Uncharacterized protein n=1 Tax=Heterorhabditis bacteriophora TaxID=37862 RepID=A0A1I7WIV8_HETBA